MVQIIALIATLPWLYGFVLLSGPEEAKLPVSPTTPTISFAISTDYPSLKEKSKFLGGKYEALDDETLWPEIIKEAMTTWNSVYGSYVKLDIDRNAAAVLDQTDHSFSIVMSKAEVTTSASAMPIIEDGVIVDCDIQVGNRKMSAESLAYTMMHELGHCLGLGHNHTNYNAVMGYSRESHKLTLSADDKAGVVYLYPDPTVDVGNSKEIISCGTIAGNKRGGAWLVLLLPLLMLTVNFAPRRGSGRTNV